MRGWEVWNTGCSRYKMMLDRAAHYLIRARWLFRNEIGTTEPVSPGHIIKE